MLGFLPYIRIPTRYILADSQTMPMAEAYNKETDNNFSHKGISKGIRTIMTIGEVNGTIEHQNASGPSGFSML